MGSIQSSPHYEVPSTELASWLEEHALHSWWNVDGDPLLTGRLDIPCPTDELATELRKINRPMYVAARKDDVQADGRLINANQLEQVAVVVWNPSPEHRDWIDDRSFYLCWKGSPHEWLLAEDSATAKQFREEPAGTEK